MTPNNLSHSKKCCIFVVYYFQQLVKNIAILGSTGSIGRQALEVIKNNPLNFRVSVLTAHHSADKLIEQAIEFKPDAVVIGCENSYEKVKSALNGSGTRVYAGSEEINNIVEQEDIDIVLVALVGFAGLKPVVRALKARRTIALANKESLVVAGELITQLANENEVTILPVDSEHSAIFQCLAGEKSDSIEKIYLTASGGPFFGKNKLFLENVTVSDTLHHPKWEMGQKITVDSASMMNKGLEVIEAKWLFNLDISQIDVIIHPQTIIHSIVQFVDGSMKAQMGLPDMRLPIQFALSYPTRIPSPFPRFDFTSQTAFTFFRPDRKNFRNLDLAYFAIRQAGNMPCILNAANEIAVEAFLKGRIRFLQITPVIEQCMEDISYIEKPDFEDLIETNKETKTYAQYLVKSYF